MLDPQRPARKDQLAADYTRQGNDRETELWQGAENAAPPSADPQQVKEDHADENDSPQAEAA
jgi:hypothetical protein